MGSKNPHYEAIQGKSFRKDENEDHPMRKLNREKDFSLVEINDYNKVLKYLS